MGDEGSTGASFNQALFSQKRIDKLFERINDCYSCPLAKNMIFGRYNYEIIISDLVSIYLTCCSKFIKKERDELTEKRKEMEEQAINSPPKTSVVNWKGKVTKANSFEAWKNLNNLIIKFREKLEELMEKYDLGNPNKDTEEGFD